MISELMPQGYDNMFFALFGITNRAVSTYNHFHPKVCFYLQTHLVLDYRPKRRPSNRQQHPEQLDGIPVPFCYLCSCNDRHRLCRY